MLRIRFHGRGGQGRFHRLFEPVRQEVVLRSVQEAVDRLLDEGQRLCEATTVRREGMGVPRDRQR
jgi:hypothetical protein